MQPSKPPLATPPKKRGKPVDPLWEVFTATPNAQQISSGNTALCRHCQTPVRHHNKIFSIQTHLLRCPQYNELMENTPIDKRPEWWEIRKRAKSGHLKGDTNKKHAANLTGRSATARATIRMPREALLALKRIDSMDGTVASSNMMLDQESLMTSKGRIDAAARIAGIFGAKQTSTLLPFSFPLPIEDCQVHIYTNPDQDDAIHVECSVSVSHSTSTGGVDMAALTGASIAALCVYDMCKEVTTEIVIENTHLVLRDGVTVEVAGVNGIARDGAAVV